MQIPRQFERLYATAIHSHGDPVVDPMNSLSRTYHCFPRFILCSCLYV